jgi:hypothetical protein
VVRELYTGIGAETRPDTVHVHVYYVMVCMDHYITPSFCKGLSASLEYRFLCPAQEELAIPLFLSFPLCVPRPEKGLAIAQVD